MSTHTYNADEICIDCCIPRFLAADYYQHSCPYTDATVSRYIGAWYPLYEATIDQMPKEIADEYFA